MNLSSSIITEKLSGQFIYTSYGKIDENLTLGRPVFQTEDTILQDDFLYMGKLTKNSPLPKRRFHSMLLAIGTLSEEMKSRFDSILLFDKSTDMLQVFNQVQNTFNMYDNWIEDMEQLCRNGCTLTELLDSCNRIFINPLLIHTSDFRFIAHSSTVTDTNNLSFLLNGGRDGEILNTFMTDKEFRDTFETHNAELFPSHATGVRTIYKNLFDHDQLLCRILLPEAVRNFQPSDTPLIEILAKYIQYQLEHNSESSNTSLYTLDKILYDLLSHKNIDPYLFNKTLTSFGWTPDNTYFCIKFMVDQLDVQNHTTKALAHSLEEIVRNSCVFEFQKEIVMYVNLGQNPEDMDNVIDSIKEFVRDSNLKAGISNAYKGFIQMYQMLYLQAGKSLGIGMRYTPFKWIHRFTEIADKYLLEKCTSELPANMVCAPEILDIYQYDETHHTDYYNTLKVFLENNMQPVITSKKLYIHRTTFLYRMDKITALFHIDLSKPDHRMFYQLSMLLLEQTNLNIGNQF